METWYSPDEYGGQFDRFAFPGRTSYYSFTYSNVAVLSLDANDVSNELPANRGYSDGGRADWLARKPAAYRHDPQIDFIVVYFHHCAYCTCTSHASEGGVRDTWVSLFDKYSVDLVINGHNHIYERTDPETVAWSRIRYTGYCLLVVDSKPAHRHGTSTLTIRGLSNTGAELDHITLARAV
jgi:3',5'-cyclic AMP phosphodiesterase CpdA